MEISDVSLVGEFSATGTASEGRCRFFRVCHALALDAVKDEVPASST
jgi:hypothetical protein